MALNEYDQTLEDMAAQPGSSPAPNPYAQTLDEQTQASEVRLKLVHSAAQDTTPDRAAQVQSLSEKTGLPPEVIGRSFEQMQKRAEIADTPYAQMLHETPVLADWLAQSPQHAAVSRDDLANLGFLEWLHTAPQRAWQQGQASVSLGLLRAKQLHGDLTADELQQIDTLRQQAQNGGALGADGHWFRGAITKTAELLPMLWGATVAGAKYGAVGATETGAAGAAVGALGAGLGAVPGAVAGATAGASAGYFYGNAKFAYELSAGLAYDQLLQTKDELGRPIDPQVAKVAAMGIGAVNGLLQTVGVRKLLEAFPGADALLGKESASVVAAALQKPTVRSALLSALGTYAKTVPAEAGLMVGQQAVQILGREAALAASGATPQSTTPEGRQAVAGELEQSFGDALQSLALISAVGPLASVAKSRVAATQALHNTTFFRALGEGTAQSKTVQRLPEAAQAFLAQATKDGPVETVYAPVEAWTTYWQSKGVDPAEMAQHVLGSKTPYDEAQRTGQDLAIPTARYAVTIAPTEHNTFFADELRLAPEQMNARESRDFSERMQQEATQTPAAPLPTPTDEIHDTITRQLETAGYERSTAESYAHLYEATFQTLGQRAGVDPVDLFNRYGLQITRENTSDAVSPVPAEAAPAGAEAFAQPGADGAISASGAAGTPTDAGAPAGTEFHQGERGSIAFGAGGQAQIKLFERADLSTFLHESGHLFLETMRGLSNEPGADSIRADLEKLHAWFGTDQIGTEQHEQFASGFEAYLMEGKAPSAELRPVFARVKAWLLGVYRSLRGLNVSLNDDVRGVFDRLLASDEAIAQAEAEGHVEPLFTDAASAGMSDAEFAKYRDTVIEASTKARDDLQRQAMRAVQQEREAWWATEREKVRATVETETHADPVYQAQAAIRFGTRPDGSLFEGETKPEPLKLAKADLVGRYTADELKQLRRYQLYSAEGGHSPDAIAETFGFSSGDELVRALLAASPMKDAIERETDARMRAAHGDLLLDGSLAEKAQEAVFAHRDQVVQAELKALTQGMVRGTIPPAAVIRQMAETRIGSTKVRELRPGWFLMAAQRASQKAFDLRDSDRAGAVQAKQQELLNLALYREALKARDEADSAATYLRSFDKATTRERIGKAGGGFLDQIDGLRDRYELARVTNTDLDRRASLSRWIATQQGEGMPVDLPESLLNEARRVNWREIPVDELRGVRDGVKQLEHLARLKNRLLRDADQRELSALAADGASSIADHSKGALPVQVEPRLPGTQTRRDARGWLIAHRPLQAILRQLDGYHDGFFFSNIWQPAHEARTREGTMGREAAAQWIAVHDARFKGEETSLYAQTFIPALNTSLSLSARLAVALNYGNEGNRERLRSAGIGNTGPMSEPQIRAVLDTLDARDWTYVRGVADLIGRYKPEIGALQKRLTGVEPTWVDPAPFQTAHGEMPGWYYPIAYEGRASARALPGPEATFADIVSKSAYARFTTNQGHTETRTAHTGIPVRADLGVIGEHLQQIVHDLTHREMLIDVGRLLGKKELQDAIYQHYGDQTYREIQGAFRDIAIGPTPAPDWYRVIGPIRRGMTMARLAWNFGTVVRHTANITSGMVRVGSADVLKAIPMWLGSARDAEHSAGWISENSDLMASRWNHRMEELATTASEIGLNRGPVAATVRDAMGKVGLDPNLAHRVSDSYLYGIHKVMQMAEIPTWIAAYEQARKSERSHTDAVASADAAVLDAFGGGDTLDLAGVQRSYAGKLFTTFMSYGLSLHRQNYEVFHSDRTIARKVVDASLLNIVPMVLTSGILYQLSGGKDGWGTELVDELFAHATGMFVFARELSSALRHPDYSGPASMAPFGTLSRLIYQSAKAIKSEQPAEAAKDVGKTAVELGGQFYGVPVFQVEKTAAGITALMEGKTHNPAAVLVGPEKKH